MSIQQTTPRKKAAHARVASPNTVDVAPEQDDQAARGRATQARVRPASRSASPAVTMPAQTEKQDASEQPGDARNASAKAADPLAEAEAALRNACDLLDAFSETAITQPNAHPPHSLASAFQAIKLADKSGHFRLLRQNASPLLSQLAGSLMLAITRLGPLCRPARIGQPSLDMSRLGVKDLAVWCHALSCAIGSHSRGLLDAQRMTACKSELRGLCNALLTRAEALGLSRQEWSYGDVLAVLALISRGRKHSLSIPGGRRESLLAPDSSTRKVFKNSLLMMRGWSHGQVGAHDGERWLDSRSLAKTMVQIGSAIKLLHKELGEAAEGKLTWAQLLPELTLELLQDGTALQAFTEWKFDETSKRLTLERTALNGVAVANIGNLLKDLLDAGLISLQSARVQAVVAALCKWIAGLKPEDLLKEGGQTLSNCANFLRAVCEPVLQEPALKLADGKSYGAACRQVLETLASCATQPRALDAQATSNLASFVKAMGKLGHSPGSLPKPSLDSLRLCVKALRGPTGKIDPAAAEVETLAALSSALSWFVQHGLQARGWQLAWLESAFATLDEAVLKTPRWASRSREQMMKTAVERFADCAAAGPAALALLPTWDKSQDRAIYLRAAFKLLQQDPKRITSLQKILRQLLQWRSRQTIGFEDVQSAVGKEPEEAPVLQGSGIVDDEQDEPLAQSADEAPSEAGPRPPLLSQMQKLAQSNTFSTTTTSATLTTTLTTTTASTTGTPAARVAGEPTWRDPIHTRAPLPPSAQALLARSALSRAGDASAHSSDSEEEPPTQKTPAHAEAAEKSHRRKRKKKRSTQLATVMTVGSKPPSEAQLLQRLCDLAAIAQTMLSPVSYAGRTRPALYWAIRLGRPDLVAQMLSTQAGEFDVLKDSVRMLKRLLVEEGMDQSMQRRSLHVLLPALRDAPKGGDEVKGQLEPCLLKAPLGLRLSFYKMSMASPPNLNFSGVPSALHARLVSALVHNDETAKAKLRTQSEAALKFIEPCSGTTALLMAVRNGISAVNFCLELGSVKQQLQARNAIGQTAITVAVIMDKADVLALLLKQAEQYPDLLKTFFRSAGSDLGNLLCTAASLKHVDCLELLLAQARKLDLLPALLLEADYSGLNPLQAAIGFGNDGAVALLLKQGESQAQRDQLNDWGMDALMAAATSGQVGIVQRLLDLERRESRLETVLARVGHSGENALQLAAKMKREEAVLVLLKTSQGRAERLLQRSRNGMTLLMKVVNACEPETLQMVLTRLREENVLEQALLQQIEGTCENSLLFALAKRDCEKLDLLLWSGSVQAQVKAGPAICALAQIQGEQGHDGPLLGLISLHLNLAENKAEAAFELGKLRAEGKIVRKNFQFAAEAYRLAANQGHAGALCELGRLRYNGHLPDTTDEQALAWLRQSVEMKCPRAHAVLAQYFLKGRGVPVDEARAVALLEAGNALGDLQSRHALAHCLESGGGMTRNPERALELFKSAAAEGHLPAKVRLEMLAAQGQSPRAQESEEQES